MASAYNAPAWAATSATDDGVVLAACCASPSIFGAGSVPVVVIDHPPRPSGEPESVRSLRGRPSAPRRECTAGRSNEDEVTQSLHHERIEGERLRYTRSEEHTSELQSHSDLVCRLLLEKKKKKKDRKLKHTNR